MESMEMTNLYNGVFKNKKVLVTGHTGFKGAWLSLWLIEMGAEVVGISNEIPTNPSLFEALNLETKMKHILADIRDLERMKELIHSEKPDFLFHLAAQAIVFKSYNNPVDTMSTNIMGTVHILEALRTMENSCTAVMITSDKCYDNVEWIWGYKETDALGGKDPYSASKGAAELMFKTYVHSYFNQAGSKIKIAAVRAGNVIGGGDWAESRIVPDCMRSWSLNETVEIRSPYATRPWQHVLEPLSGYLLTAQALSEGKKGIHGEPFNFGPGSDQNKTVTELIDKLSFYWTDDGYKMYKVTNDRVFHEAGLLKLNCDKALFYLQWKPVLVFEETTSLTALWYKQFYNHSANLYEFTIEQIQSYIELAKKRNLVWSS